MSYVKDPLEGLVLRGVHRPADSLLDAHHQDQAEALRLLGGGQEQPRRVAQGGLPDRPLQAEQAVLLLQK